MKADDGVVMVESRAAHLAEVQPQTNDVAGKKGKEDSNLVRLSGKKKPKKKPSNGEDGLF